MILPRTVLVCLLLSPAVALAADGLSFSGKAQIRIEAYPSPPMDPLTGLEQTDTVNAMVDLRLQPQLKVKAGPVRGRAQILFEHDFIDGQNSQIRLDDLWVEWRQKWFRLRVGNQVDTWSIMDVQKPADAHVRQDWRELWAPETLRTPSIRATVARPSWGLDLLLVPVFLPDAFRFGAPSRWDTTRPQPHAVDLGASSPTVVHFESIEPYRLWVREDGALHRQDANRKGFLDPEIGLRWTGHAGPVDAGVHVFHGRDQLPTTIDFDVASQTTGPGGEVISADVRITPLHGRFTTFGGNLAVTTGPIVWKMEGGAFLTADRKREYCMIDDDYLRWAAGGEALLDNLVGSSDVQIRIEVSGDHQFPRSGDSVINHVPELGDPACMFGIRDVRHVNRLIVGGNLQWDFGPLALDVRGFVSYEGDYLIRPALVLQPAGALEFELGGLVVGGGSGDWFAAYGKNDRLDFTARLEF